MNVEAYGITTNLPWKMGLQTSSGLQYVHPTFLYESIADFIIFCILIKLSKNRKYPGQIMVWYFILYSFIRFWIEGLRMDSLMLGEARVSQIVSIAILGLTIAFVPKLKKKRKCCIILLCN